MRYFCLLVLFSATIMGCKKEYPDPAAGYAYYKLLPEEIAQIPSYNESDILIYTNQKGDSMNFVMGRGDTSFKRQYTVGMGFFSGSSAGYYYFYDEIKYEFFRPRRSAEIEITYRKWPTDYDSAESNPTRLFPAKFYPKIEFKIWNGFPYENETDSFYRNYYRQQPDVPATGNTTLQINNTFYPNVAKIVTTNPDTSNAYRTVNTLYYAYKQGIIGFDERNGNQWRLQK